MQHMILWTLFIQRSSDEVFSSSMVQQTDVRARVPQVGTRAGREQG